MRRCVIHCLIEPFGREVVMTVDAETSREALMIALVRLELEPEELLRHVHIGRPLIIDSQNTEGA